MIFALAADRFGWTHDAMMRMRPRLLLAYLQNLGEALSPPKETDVQKQARWDRNWDRMRGTLGRGPVPVVPRAPKGPTLKPGDRVVIPARV